MQTLLFSVHIASLCIAGMGILIADTSAFAWIRGRTETVGKRALFVSHWVVTSGLVGLVLSGLLLFWPMRNYLITQPFFWTKMAFVAALLINSFFIEYLMHTATHTPFRMLGLRQKAPLFVSGAVSTISWIGAVTVALLYF